MLNVKTRYLYLLAILAGSLSGIILTVLLPQGKTTADYPLYSKTSNGTSVLYFEAEWCGGCKTYLPELSALSEKLSDKAKVFRVDVDEHPNFTSHYKIHLLPTILVTHEGEEIQRMAGGVFTDKIIETINELSDG